MSQKVKYAVEIERVVRPVVNRAVNELAKQLNAEILHQKEFEIYRDKLPVRGTCIKLPNAMYPVDVYVDETGQLIVNGDDMDVEKVARQIKQFYKATNMASLTGAQIQYNKRSRKVRLRMKVR